MTSKLSENNISCVRAWAFVFERLIIMSQFGSILEILCTQVRLN